jgi:ABC-type branched-subunit amino acid transport system permease subunit
VSVTDEVVGPPPSETAQTRRRLIAAFTGESNRLAPPAYRGHQWIFLFLVTILALFVPSVFGGDPYHQGVVNNVMLAAIVAFGFYWIFALSGQFSFATFAMYALGAYVSAWGAHHLGSFWWGFALAMVVSGLIGAAMRLAFFRLTPIYFAIATLAVGSLLAIVFREWTGFTGGFQGEATTPPSLFGYHIDTQFRQYYLMLAVLVVFVAATIAVIRSPVARELAFSRSNPAVAATTGLRPAQLTLVAFVVGSAMQGAAGSLYAHTAGYFSLESFDVTLSLNVLLMVLLGGMGSIYGPIIGAVIITYLPELLRNERQYADLINAALVLAIVLTLPSGVAGFRQIVAKAVRRARRN